MRSWGRGVEAKERMVGKRYGERKSPCQDSLHQRIRTGYVTCAKTHNHTLQNGKKYIVI